GQADFARGAMYSHGGQGFVVVHSTAHNGTISRIVPQLAPGDVVTTLKNTVDNVVTEWGVAELRGRTIRQRAHALIRIAHPPPRRPLSPQAHPPRLHLGPPPLHDGSPAPGCSNPRFRQSRPLHPGSREVLVRIEPSGLCHTDIHAARGDWPVEPSLPFIPGH